VGVDEAIPALQFLSEFGRVNEIDKTRLPEFFKRREEDDGVVGIAHVLVRHCIQLMVTDVRLLAKDVAGNRESHRTIAISAKGAIPESARHADKPVVDALHALSRLGRPLLWRFYRLNRKRDIVEPDGVRLSRMPLGKNGGCVPEELAVFAFDPL